MRLRAWIGTTDSCIDRSLDDGQFRESDGNGRPGWDELIYDRNTMTFVHFPTNPSISALRRLPPPDASIPIAFVDARMTRGVDAFARAPASRESVSSSPAVPVAREDPRRAPAHRRGGRPAKVIVFSRDEAKQHFMRIEYQQRANATDDIIWHNFQRAPRVPDRRRARPSELGAALRDADIVVQRRRAEAGADVRVLPVRGGPDEHRRRREHRPRHPASTTSRSRPSSASRTDKACKPVNVMGMTKAIQERVFIEANMRVPATRGSSASGTATCSPRAARWSRSSTSRSATGGPVTITDDGHDALPAHPGRGGRYRLRRAPARPRRARCSFRALPARSMIDVARALIGERDIRPMRHRHPARREDPRDHGLARRSASPNRGAGATTTRSCPMLPEVLAHLRRRARR